MDDYNSNCGNDHRSFIELLSKCIVGYDDRDGRHYYINSLPTEAECEEIHKLITCEIPLTDIERLLCENIFAYDDCGNLAVKLLGGYVEEEPEPDPEPYMGYGILYNWYATDDARNICNAGWHIPSATEWETLRTYLTANGYGYGGSGSDIAKSLASISGWKISVFAGQIGNDQASNNSSGFNAKPAGWRVEIGGNFSALNEINVFWSSTEYAYYEQAYYSLLNWDLSFFLAGLDDYKSKCRGYSIREIKDDSTDPGTMTDIDGNIYPTVKIGTQVWMASNLIVEHYSDGTPIPEVQNDAAWEALATGAYCWYNNIPE